MKTQIIGKQSGIKIAPFFGPSAMKKRSSICHGDPWESSLPQGLDKPGRTRDILDIDR